MRTKCSFGSKSGVQLCKTRKHLMCAYYIPLWLHRRPEKEKGEDINKTNKVLCRSEWKWVCEAEGGWARCSLKSQRNCSIFQEGKAYDIQIWLFKVKGNYSALHSGGFKALINVKPTGYAVDLHEAYACTVVASSMCVARTGHRTNASIKPFPLSGILLDHIQPGVSLSAENMRRLSWKNG